LTLMENRNIIIVESGATKSDWLVLDANGNTLKRFNCPGINVSTMKGEDIGRIITGAFNEEIRDVKAESFLMYTAGVVSGEVRTAIASIVKGVSGITDTDVQDDLMGAARAVCGHNPGIAAILGTGSNACFYDGRSVNRKVYSGGFILGDEGSAATLGRLFLSDLIKGMVPGALAEEFGKEFDASYAGIVKGVYRSVSPSAYLGSIAPFVVRHASDPYVRSLLLGNFRSFIERVLLQYDTASYPVGIVGGFAWACRDWLLPLLEQNGIRVSKIIEAPIEGLCEYHLGKR